MLSYHIVSADVAQLVEQHIRNVWVGGSSPFIGTTNRIKYMIKVGIIGVTGRMGKILSEQINDNKNFDLGISYSRSNGMKLNEVFIQNDYVIDFSSGSNVKDILVTAQDNPKPILLCSSGWDAEDYAQELHILSSQVPVVIAPNTSYLVAITKKIVAELSQKLGDEYDIDIIDRHHRNKIDQISGTAQDLVRVVEEQKDGSYITQSPVKSPRADNIIALSSERRGNLFGSHEVIFTSRDEAISLKHESFNRDIYAKEAMVILKWLQETKPSPAIYYLEDIHGLDKQ